MYQRPENASTWYAFWARVQTAGRRYGLTLPELTAPEAISHPWTDHWLRPDLALSMTCGLPFRTVLKDKVTFVGTLDFGVTQKPGHYASVVLRGPSSRDIANGDVDQRHILAFNSADSQSGWAASQSAAPFDRPPAFSGYLETGSHAASLAAVAEGRADIAYIDAVTWRILQTYDPKTLDVEVIGKTPPTPGLPLITAKGNDPVPLRQTFYDVLSDGDLGGVFDAFGGPISFHVLDPEDYYAVPVPKPPNP